MTQFSESAANATSNFYRSDFDSLLPALSVNRRGFIVTALVRIPEGFGRKQAE